MDIPSADLVVFYEPVSSEIRTIQRRGRTGRRRGGEVVVLIAEGTRDESAKDSARRKEEFMHKAARRVSRGLAGTPTGTCLTSPGSRCPRGCVRACCDFVLEARERHRGALREGRDSLGGWEEGQGGVAPGEFPTRGQTGLDQF